MNDDSRDASDPKKSLTLVIKRARTRVASGVRTGLWNSCSVGTCLPFSDPTAGGVQQCAGGGKSKAAE
jgi:hypothetical protein